MSLGILLDISGSMATDAKARAADDARWADTRRALETARRSGSIRRDEVLFAAFSDKVGLAVPWTRDHQQVTRAFNTLRPGGYTAMFDAVKLDRAGVPARGTRAQGAARHFRWPGQSGAAHHYGRARSSCPDPTPREQQVQHEIHQRQQALRDVAVGAAQRAVNESGAAFTPSGWGQARARMSICRTWKRSRRFRRLRRGDQRSGRNYGRRRPDVRRAAVAVHARVRAGAVRRQISRDSGDDEESRPARARPGGVSGG